MWGSMLNELTNHSQPKRVSSLRSRWYLSDMIRLPSCAASADASQIDILLCQCRLLRRERRHREPSGPVMYQEISCFPLGPCKCPVTTGSGRQAGGLGSLFPGTEPSGHTHLTGGHHCSASVQDSGGLELASSDGDGDLIYPPLFP